MDSSIYDRYMALPVSGKVQAEYIFIDNDGDVRSKCRTVAKTDAVLGKLPSWNYDGSSTEQGTASAARARRHTSAHAPVFPVRFSCFVLRSAG